SPGIAIHQMLPVQLPRLERIDAANGGWPQLLTPTAGRVRTDHPVDELLRAFRARVFAHHAQAKTIAGELPVVPTVKTNIQMSEANVRQVVVIRCGAGYVLGRDHHLLQRHRPGLVTVAATDA